MATVTRRGVLGAVTAAILLVIGCAVGIVLADLPVWDLTADEVGGKVSDRDIVMGWLAAVLLVLALAWLIIGMLAARTRLVGRPGAAAARATWLASTRPWRAHESTLGMLRLDMWLLLVVPGGLLVATRAVQTSFRAPVPLAIVLGGWIVFAIVVRLVIGQFSPWPVIAAVGGAVVLRCTVTLLALTFTGPAAGGWMLWTVPALRAGFLAIGVALFLWVFVAAGWSLVSQVGARRATGAALAAVGAGLAVPALIVALVGFERVLTAWNDQLGLLPWDPSRIFGVTVRLAIPVGTAWWAFAIGMAVALIGVALALPKRSTNPDHRAR